MGGRILFHDQTLGFDSSLIKNQSAANSVDV